MENFGEYITKEYGLSKKILSYLPLCDLLKVRRVCRDWHDMVDLIIANEFSKEPEVRFSFINETREEEEYGHWSSLKFVPEVIIKCVTDNRKSTKIGESTLVVNNINSVWKPLYYPGESGNVEGSKDKSRDASPTVIHLECVGCFRVREEDRRLAMEHSAFFDGGGSVTLGLPKIPGVHYTLFFTPLKLFKAKRKQDYHIEELHRDKDKGPVRCVLIFENCHSHTDYAVLNRFVWYVMETIKGQQETPFALGGGKVDGLNWWRNDKFNEGGSKSANICGIVVRGENVVAHSDVMVEELTTGDINNFMEQFAQRVGPTPEGAFRIAIMAQCVDRPEKLRRIYRFPDTEIEILELSYFSKHFPNTPAFGFTAGGEFGTLADSNQAPDTDYQPDAKVRKRDIIDIYNKLNDYMHWQSSSIVILTFLNARK